MRNGLSIEKQKLEQILSVRYYRRHNDLSDEKMPELLYRVE